MVEDNLLFRDQMDYTVHPYSEFAQLLNAFFHSLLRRWFQVTSSHVAHVPPVVHACETIESKNREIVQMLADPLDQPIQKLSLSLQVE